VLRDSASTATSWSRWASAPSAAGSRHAQHHALRECLEEAYLKGPTVHNPSGQIPNDPEIPLLLNKVYPAHEVVKVDYFLQGCPRWRTPSGLP